MKRNRIIHGIIAAALLTGCATAGSNLPELAVLRSPWDGTFTSTNASHNGRIHINVTEESAAEVLIVAGESLPRGSRYWDESAAPQMFAGARIERTSADRVRFTLPPYREVICGCDVALTFDGVVKGDALDGSYQARTLAGAIAFEGKWNVRRIDTDR